MFEPPRSHDARRSLPRLARDLAGKAAAYAMAITTLIIAVPTLAVPQPLRAVFEVGHGVLAGKSVARTQPGSEILP